MCKKVTGEAAKKHYERMDRRTGEIVEVAPEFSRMSLKPGIGYEWFRRYWREVYEARDGIVVRGGKVLPPPRYYDKLLAEMNDDLSEYKKKERYENSKRFVEDTRPDRLLVRESIAQQKFDRKRKKL